MKLYHLFERNYLARIRFQYERIVLARETRNAEYFLRAEAPVFGPVLDVVDLKAYLMTVFVAMLRFRFMLKHRYLHKRSCDSL